MNAPIITVTLFPWLDYWYDRLELTCALLLALHASAARSELSKFQMPAMSPTMTEGGIASWKLKEGDTFTTGDVLVEIETDKATIDVEAQDDGVLAKIIVRIPSIPKGMENWPLTLASKTMEPRASQSVHP